MADLTFDLNTRNLLPDFRQLLAPHWSQLAWRVKRRFSCHQVTTYHGEMSEVRCSRVGMLYAHICRFLGSALVYKCGEQIKTDVSVYPTRDRRGMVWDRAYHFPNGTVLARSVKTWHEGLGLMECVNGGLGMLLSVTARDGVVTFVSTRYFVRVPGRHVTIPDWITPGVTRVTHRDIGGGEFVFELSIRHPLFGETFFQTGIFRDPLG